MNKAFKTKKISTGYQDYKDAIEEMKRRALMSCHIMVEEKSKDVACTDCNDNRAFCYCLAA